jgi:uncharacterized hydantoinase/oxoprolinase family protein
MKQQQFKVQDVLFDMLTNTLKVKEILTVLYAAWASEKHITSARSCSSFLLLDTAATTLTIITEIVYTGNTLCGKTVIHRCMRTKFDIPFST